MIRHAIEPIPLEMFTILGEAVDFCSRGANRLVTTAGPVAFVSKLSRIVGGMEKP